MIDVPLLFAFSAGMVATVNPCGFAMLPSFVSYLLGADEPDFAAAPKRSARNARTASGAAAAAGFIAVFAAAGGAAADRKSVG